MINLNDAQFVGSFAHGAYVYTFYRQRVPSRHNENQVHTRVARVCVNDNGYASNQIELATFISVRLNCSLPGAPPGRRVCS